jgi:vitamin B12 transporter
MKFEYPLTGTACAAALLLVFSAGLAASEPALELEPLRVVTASRHAEDAGRAMASVSVITAREIEQSAAQDLLELLRLQPGLDVVRSGGAGGQTSVFMRGGNSNPTLVLIDGIRVASANSGAFSWEHLPLNLVERIEIVRGPRATLFGADALGGVIQVFTRRAAGPYARLTAGSYGSRELEAGSGFTTAGGQFSLSAAWRDSDGFSSQNESGFSYHPDKDGFESRNVGITGSGEAGSGHWQMQLMAMDNQVEFDQGVSTAEFYSGAFSFRKPLRDQWSVRLRAGFADEKLASDFGFFNTGFESRRFDLAWENHLRLEHSNLTLGLDHHAESGVSDSTYDESRHNTALFALWEQDAGRGRYQLSGRLDDNSLFGSEFTYQAGIGLAAGVNGELMALAGTAFRAPTLNEQFSPGFGGLFAGNPSLRPESSASLELIYRANPATGLRLDISAYHTRVDDLIAFSGVDFQAVNINRAELRGIELQASVERGPWRFGGNATVQNTEDRATGMALLRRPDEKGSLTASREFANGSWLAAEWFASGKRLDFGASLPGYSLLNLSGGYRFSPALSLQLRLDNLLDRDYEPAAGFNSAARSAFVSLSWSP